MDVFLRHPRHNRLVGSLTLAFGVLTTALMATLFVWPGMLAEPLFPHLTWVQGDGPEALFLNLLVGVTWLVWTAALVFFLVLVPFVALPLCLLVGVPAMVGGVFLLQGHPWAPKVLVVPACFWLVLFPVGTWFGLVLLKRLAPKV